MVVIRGVVAQNVLKNRLRRINTEFMGATLKLVFATI